MTRSTSSTGRKTGSCRAWEGGPNPRRGQRLRERLSQEDRAAQHEDRPQHHPHHRRFSSPAEAVYLARFDPVAAKNGIRPQRQPDETDDEVDGHGVAQRISTLR